MELCRAARYAVGRPSMPLNAGPLSHSCPVDGRMTSPVLSTVGSPVCGRPSSVSGGRPQWLLVPVRPGTSQGQASHKRELTKPRPRAALPRSLASPLRPGAQLRVSRPRTTSAPPARLLLRYDGRRDLVVTARLSRVQGWEGSWPPPGSCLELHSRSVFRVVATRAALAAVSPPSFCCVTGRAAPSAA